MSLDRMKPDKTKIAMSMYFMGQINILDTKTGNLKGFRLENSIDFTSLGEDPEKLLIYYIDICADDNYIYALYVDKPFANGAGFDELGDIIHILDWTGKPLHEIQLDKKVSQIAFDQQRGFIVYRFDVTSLFH